MTTDRSGKDLAVGAAGQLELTRCDEGRAALVSRPDRQPVRERRVDLRAGNDPVRSQLSTALRRFGEILDRDDVRVPRLVQASATEPPVVRERLRAVLTHSGHADQAESIAPARDARTRAKALRVLTGAL